MSALGSGRSEATATGLRLLRYNKYREHGPTLMTFCRLYGHIAGQLEAMGILPTRQYPRRNGDEPMTDSERVKSLAEVKRRASMLFNRRSKSRSLS